jgi:repressor of nif and glnA expression
VTIRQIQRMKVLAEAGMSCRAISIAMSHYEEPVSYRQVQYHLRYYTDFRGKRRGNAEANFR